MRVNLERWVYYEDTRIEWLELWIQRHMKYQTALGIWLMQAISKRADKKSYCFHCARWNLEYQHFQGLKLIRQIHPGLIELWYFWDKVSNSYTYRISTVAKERLKQQPELRRVRTNEGPHEEVPCLVLLVQRHSS